ncbi:MAG: NAD(P)/FAD-dependent oxidoreductase [Bacillota bacterium]
MSAELNTVKKALTAVSLGAVEVTEKQGAVVLEGRVNCWQQYLDAGYAAAGQGFRGVVNDLEVEGMENSVTQDDGAPEDYSLEKCAFDVVVIGGGVIGCAIARELTRYNISVVLLEKESDLARHTSGRNNGMIHPAMTVKRGTKKHYYNLRGNRMYSEAAKELGFDLKWPGSFAMLDKSWQLVLGPYASWLASQKGVQGFRVLNERKVKQFEPKVWEGQKGAFFMPESGVVDPFQVTIAYAENAIQNGASVFLNTKVLGFERNNKRITAVRTSRGAILAKVVINAAGVWADRVAEMAGDRFYTIHPRKGVMAVLDKKTGTSQKYILGRAQLSSDVKTKGGGLLPLLAGNILAGPTADEVPEREDYSTKANDLQHIIVHHLVLNQALQHSDIITYFAGTRACTFEEDFIVEASDYIENLVHAAGIQSPGLASAPAIAVDVRDITAALLKEQIDLKENPHFNPNRKASLQPDRLSLAERNRVTKGKPAYGRIVCRCELVSEGEITDRIHAPLPAHTLDAVKCRTRAGMGRCQGGFCTPAVINILARETGCQVTDICKHEPGSQLIMAKTRGKGSEQSEN